MADVDVTIGLDYSRYKAGLRDVDASTRRTTRSIEQQFRQGMRLGGGALVIGMAAKAWREAIDLVREYGKENERAQHVVGRWDATAKFVRMSLAEALTPKVDYITRKIDDNLFDGVGEAKVQDDESMARFKTMREQIQSRRAFRSEFGRDLDRDNNAQLRRQGSGFLADVNEANQKARDRQSRLDAEPSLSAQAKAGYARVIENFRRAEIRGAADDAVGTQRDAIERARRSIGSRSLDAGAGGDAFVRSGVFNKAFAQYDPVKEEIGKLRRIEEETKKVLEKIERNTATPGAAIAG